MPPKSTSVRPASGKGAPSSGGTGAKKSGGAGKPAPATAAGAATDELKQKAELLERGLRNEELARNAMQLERNKIQAFWDITRRELGDAKAELLTRERGLEEEQDRHALELKVYKQKVKHLLYEQQGQVSRLKADGEAALKRQGELFAQQEAQLGDDKRRLRQHVREQELSSEELIKQFRLDNAKQVSRLRQEFEGQARQIQNKYEAQLRALQAATEGSYAADLADLEQRSSGHVAALMAAHEAAVADMRGYYSQVTLANLDLIKALKEEISGMKAAEAQREKLVGDVVRENRALVGPLGKAVQEADVLRQQLEGAQRDRAALAATKARLAAAERQGRARDWELEVTQQQLEKVQQQLLELQRRHEALALQARHRSALRDDVLERRLQAAEAELQQQQVRRQQSCERAQEVVQQPQQQPTPLQQQLLDQQDPGDSSSRECMNTARSWVTEPATHSGTAVPPLGGSGSGSSSSRAGRQMAASEGGGSTARNPCCAASVNYGWDAVLAAALAAPLPDDGSAAELWDGEEARQAAQQVQQGPASDPQLLDGGEREQEATPNSEQAAVDEVAGTQDLPVPDGSSPGKVSTQPSEPAPFAPSTTNEGGADDNGEGSAASEAPPAAVQGEQLLTHAETVGGERTQGAGEQAVAADSTPLVPALSSSRQGEQ